MPNSLIGQFELPQTLEDSWQCASQVDLGKYVEEGSNSPGPVMQNQCPPHSNVDSVELGCGVTVSSGPKYPPGFEGFCGGIEPLTGSKCKM